jgi:hypothetical protein
LAGDGLINVKNAKQAVAKTRWKPSKQEVAQIIGAIWPEHRAGRPGFRVHKQNANVDAECKIVLKRDPTPGAAQSLDIAKKLKCGRVKCRAKRDPTPTDGFGSMINSMRSIPAGSAWKRFHTHL